MKLCASIVHMIGQNSRTSIIPATADIWLADCCRAERSLAARTPLALLTTIASGCSAACCFLTLTGAMAMTLSDAVPSGPCMGTYSTCGKKQAACLLSVCVCLRWR